MKEPLNRFMLASETVKRKIWWDSERQIALSCDGWPLLHGSSRSFEAILVELQGVESVQVAGRAMGCRAVYSSAVDCDQTNSTNNKAKLNPQSTFTSLPKL